MISCSTQRSTSSRQRSTNWETGFVGSGRILVDYLKTSEATRATREDTKLRGYSYPEMKVLRLSKAIYEEASSFFYARHHLEMSVRMDRKKIAPQLPDNLPFERFTDLRMLFIHYGCCYLQCIGSDLDVDFSGLLASLPALRTVHISVRDYTFIDQYASAYPESPALDELVKQIKVSVPASVGIKWEYWKGESPVGHDAEDCINGIPTQSTDLDVLPAVAARV